MIATLCNRWGGGYQEVEDKMLEHLRAAVAEEREACAQVIDTWQRQGDTDEWVYGVPVRGIVRKILAEVYYDEDHENAGWHWIVYDSPGHTKKGWVINLRFAVEMAENEMGVTDAT